MTSMSPDEIAMMTIYAFVFTYVSEIQKSYYKSTKEDAVVVNRGGFGIVYEQSL